jgi:alpha-D-ribose 1-methylphosphonate 5-triphosphate diphosphatase
MTMQTILTNATLVLDNETINGTISFDPTGIQSIDQGRSSLPAAIDVGGDFVAPGLIEMHTDNLEKHCVPRPGVVWPNGLAAALTHDQQMAAAGVTTVYDAICAGFDALDDSTTRGVIFPLMFKAVETGVTEKLFRIEHRLHLRCELAGNGLIPAIEPIIDHPLVRLVSLMDHTPGQRQWRDLASHKTYTIGSSTMTEAQYNRKVAEQIEIGESLTAKNWPVIVEMCRARAIPLATHDDTTVDHVEQGVASGAVISEFPTTVEAAAAAKARGLATIAGAPNVVRGGSHSGGVSVRELATLGLLDGLSSDYVPASLLQAVERLHRLDGFALHDVMALVTSNVAHMLNIRDRGWLKTGLRADVVQFAFFSQTPVVRGVWSQGRRAL